MTAEQFSVQRVSAALISKADAARAEAQQEYMKSAMPYFGVAMGPVRATTRELSRGWAPDRRTWQASVQTLWDEATHREHRYVAIGVARLPLARQWQDPEMMTLYRHLVVTGAWWDWVDEIAAHLVGSVLLAHREPATEILREWAVAPDLWLRRTAILSQLRHFESTDRRLLAAAIEANLGDKSFWIRKAIGWSLREFARTDASWVLEQVARWGDDLSALSRREATKHLGSA